MSFQISILLDKMESEDKDYRFMATNDLMQGVKTGVITLDKECAKKVLKMLMALVSDKNGEVQNLAIKCLGLLAGKLEQTLVIELAEFLCKSMLAKDNESCDISSVALKSVFTELLGQPYGRISNVLDVTVPMLLDVLKDLECGDSPMKLEVLDILTDILTHHGNFIQLRHEKITEMLVRLMHAERQALRKRTVICFGRLMNVAKSTLYTSTMDLLLTDFKNLKIHPNTFRNLIQLMEHICSSSPDKFAPYVPQIIPILLACCSTSDKDEVRDSSLQALRVFIFRCPKNAGNFINDIVAMLSELIMYDPNYTEGDGDQDSMDQADDYFCESDYSDEDDTSWKVRRASAKCMEALALSRREELLLYFTKLGPILLSRFSERDDSVKSDVMNAYSALLSQARNRLHNLVSSWEFKSAGGDCQLIEIGHFAVSMNAISPEQIDLLRALKSQVPLFVKSIVAEINKKNTEVQKNCITLITDFSRSYPTAFSENINSFMPYIISLLGDQSSNSMKISALEFLVATVSTNIPKVLAPYMEALFPLIIKAIKHSLHRISSVGMTVATCVLKTFQQLDAFQPLFDLSSYIRQVSKEVVKRLCASDMDQELRENAITSISLLVANFGNILREEIPVYLTVLADRLKYEPTSFITVKAFITIANSPYKISLTSIYEDILSTSIELLRRNFRPLKVTTIKLLDATAQFELGNNFDEKIEAVVKELTALISDTDVYISQSVLSYLSHLLRSHPNVVASNVTEIINAFVKYIQSPVLNSSSMCCDLEFIKNLVQSPFSSETFFENLFANLCSSIYNEPGLNIQAFYNISFCVATMIKANSDLEKASAVLAKFMSSAETESNNGRVRIFSILSIGEIGKLCPKLFDQFDQKPEELMIAEFQSSSEEMKAAASYALGQLCLGDLGKYLPYLLNEINNKSKLQYLLLHSLKEVIRSESDKTALEILRPRINQIWLVLMRHADNSEEGTRNVVSECLGKVCSIRPELLLPQLKECLASTVPNLRCSAVNAFKLLVVGSDSTEDEVLSPYFPEILAAVRDTDLNVRRIAIIALNSVAHNKPYLIRDFAGEFLHDIYNETVRKEALVKEICMGPFKHYVDEGLEIRKAAFECMNTLLDTCLEKIDIYEFLSSLENGLKDIHDIRVLSYLILQRVATLCPTQIIQRIECLCEIFKSQLTTSGGASADTMQAKENQKELHRHVIRAIIVIQRIPEADRFPPFLDIISCIRSSEHLNDFYIKTLKSGLQRPYSCDYDMEVD